MVLKSNRVKKKWRVAVWLNDDQLKILERLAYKNGANRAEIMRWAMMDLASSHGVFLKESQKG
jgi:hypothetical protein